MALTVSTLAAPGITNCHRTGHLQKCLRQHFPNFRKACRTQNLHTGNGAQIADIKNAVMGFSVRPHQTGTVHTKHHVLVGQRNIVEQHIKSPLQKARINAHNRFQSLLRHTRRHGNRVFLANTYIEEPFRILLLKAFQSGTVQHCCRNRRDRWVLFRHRCQCLSENIRKILTSFCPNTLRRVKCGNTVIQLRLLLGIGITLAFDRDHMNQNGNPHFSGIRNRLLQCMFIMSVNGSEVIEPHIPKNITGQQTGFHPFLGRMKYPVNGLDSTQCFMIHPLEIKIRRFRAHVRQHFCHTAHTLADAHGIVIQNDNHGFSALPRVGNGLIRQTTGHRAITNHSANVVIFPFQGPRPGHTQGYGNRRRRMTGNERIAGALPRFGKAGKTAVFPQR